MKKIAALLILALVLLPTVQAHASVYTPRIPGYGVQLRASQTFSLGTKACPKVGHATANAITQQGPRIQMYCGVGHTASVEGVVNPTYDPVSGYFKYHIINGSLSLDVQENFSALAGQCANPHGCTWAQDYTAPGSWQVAWVEFWADHAGSLIYAQCH